MPKYKCDGMDHTGLDVSLTFDAENERVAIQSMRQRGYFPTRIVSLDEARQPATRSVPQQPVTTAPPQPTLVQRFIRWLLY